MFNLTGAEWSSKKAIGMVPCLVKVKVITYRIITT